MEVFAINNGGSHSRGPSAQAACPRQVSRRGRSPEAFVGLRGSPIRRCRDSCRLSEARSWRACRSPVCGEPVESWPDSPNPLTVRQAHRDRIFKHDASARIGSEQQPKRYPTDVQEPRRPGIRGSSQAVWKVQP